MMKAKWDQTDHRRPVVWLVFVLTWSPSDSSHLCKQAAPTSRSHRKRLESLNDLFSFQTFACLTGKPLSTENSNLAERIKDGISLLLLLLPVTQEETWKNANRAAVKATMLSDMVSIQAQTNPQTDKCLSASQGNLQIARQWIPTHTFGPSHWRQSQVIKRWDRNNNTTHTSPRAAKTALSQIANLDSLSFSLFFFNPLRSSWLNHRMLTL